MAAAPMGATSNAGNSSFGTKVHNAALLAGKVKTVVDAARWAYPIIKSGVMLARPLLMGI